MSVKTGSAEYVVKTKIRMTVTTAKNAQAKKIHCSAFSLRYVLRDTNANSRFLGA